jgi:hypothetical protein
MEACVCVCVGGGGDILSWLCVMMKFWPIKVNVIIV